MKLVIFGSVGSGKTTLAKKLSLKCGIPHFEGDQIAWGFSYEERFKRTDEQQVQRILEIDKNDNWIIEGSPRKCQECIFDLADKIIFLDTPLIIRYKRIILRFLKQKLGKEKSNYTPTLSMFKMMFVWTKEFEKDRSRHEAKLKQYPQKLIWIKSEKELKDKLL